MAFIYMDYIGPLINNFRVNSSMYQRFKRRWSLDPDGVHYAEKLIFYQGQSIVEDIGMKRFLNAMGSSYDDLRDNDYDEIEDAWFFFNREKAVTTESTDSSTTTLLSDELNSKLTVGDVVHVRLTYGGSTKQNISEHEEGWAINSVGEIESSGMNSSEIMEIIKSEPWKYIANIVNETSDRDSIQFHVKNTGDVNWSSNRQPKGNGMLRSTPVTTTSVIKTSGEYNDVSVVEYFSLALLDYAETCFELTKNSDGSVKIIDSVYSSYGKASTGEEYFNPDGSLRIDDKNTIDYPAVGLSSGYSETYEFTFTGCSENDALIEELNENVKYLSVKDKLQNNLINTMQKMYMRNLLNSAVGATGSWNQYFNGNKLIKAKVDGMKRYEFVNMMSECLDTGFKEEEASTFEKLFSVVILVAAIVVTIWSAGLAAGAFSLTGLAMGLGYASLVLTIGGLVLSQMGLSANSLVKTIGKVAQVVGLLASITGIMAAVQGAFNRFAQEAVDKGIIQSTAEYTVSSFADDVVNNVIDNLTKNVMSVLDLATNPMKVLFGDVGSFSDIGTFGWLGRLEQGMSAYNKFMGNSADSQSPATPTEEQLEKRSFQYPEQMFELSEQMIYEPDSLQKMSILKDNQFGLARTEKLMEQIA